MRKTNRMLRILPLLIVTVCCFAWDKTEEAQKHEEICREVSEFTPTFCCLPPALKYCRSFCIKRFFQDKLTCGKRKKEKQYYKTGGRKRVRRIVGGRESEQGEWPWMVSLRFNGGQECGGFILSERFVLAAGHCFLVGLNPADWTVIAGDHQLSVEENFEQRIQVKRIIINPDFDSEIFENDRGFFYDVYVFDVAILELEEPINLQDENKGTLCLPDSRQPPEAIRTCRISGWGHTSFNGERSNTLKDAEVLTVPTSRCNLPRAYNNTVDGTHNICAGFDEGGVDACNFDSGGPLFCRNKGRWHAIGVVSSGLECARPFAYGLYARLTRYKNFIVETILKTQIMS